MSSESAHVQWLFNEKKRLDDLIAKAPERKRKIDEETKVNRRKRVEVNKMIALYGAAEPDEEAAVIAEIDGRIKCPHCTDSFSSKALVGTHMRKVHDIFGGLSGKVRPERNSGKARAA
jgi:uncharacterized protein YdcH (DUF465 family)